MNKKMIFQTEIVTGKCPECVCNTILIGFENSFYRCTNCGSDLEQKINGHIKYISDMEKKVKQMHYRNGNGAH